MLTVIIDVLKDSKGNKKIIYSNLANHNKYRTKFVLFTDKINNMFINCVPKYMLKKYPGMDHRFVKFPTNRSGIMEKSDAYSAMQILKMLENKV